MIYFFIIYLTTTNINNNLMHTSNSCINKQVNKFKKIFKTHDIEEAIDIISELKFGNLKKKIGKKKSFEIYCDLCHDLFPYSEKKYGNNISKYQKLIHSNIKKAYDHIH